MLVPCLKETAGKEFYKVRAAWNVKASGKGFHKLQAICNVRKVEAINRKMKATSIVKTRNRRILIESNKTCSAKWVSEDL